MNRIVQQPRHGVQPVDRIDGDTIQHQMAQHDDQQQGKRPVQTGVLFLCRKIDICHKGQNQKQRNFHSQHRLHSFMILYAAAETRDRRKIQGNV